MLEDWGRRRAGREKWAFHGCESVDNGVQCRKMIDLGLVQVHETLQAVHFGLNLCIIYTFRLHHFAPCIILTPVTVIDLSNQ
jgi:hypothetical protein